MSNHPSPRLWMAREGMSNFQGKRGEWGMLGGEEGAEFVWEMIVSVGGEDLYGWGTAEEGGVAAARRC